MTSNSYKTAFEKGLTILIGGHGSGKSEFAIMWSRRLIKVGRKPVTLVDLDTIKPLFRSQEASDALKKEGIEVVISSVPHSDMPAISSTMFGMINNPDNWIVVDVGGDAVGARILASIRNNLHGRDHNLIYILNISRPFNSTTKASLKELKRIEIVSGMKVTGLVSNTHMLDETDVEMIEKGIETAYEISEKEGIDFLGVMATENMVERLKIPAELEIFTIHRMLNPYWMRD
ncbi:MAG: hypothetical protein ABIG42_01795 [bacterium]